MKKTIYTLILIAVLAMGVLIGQYFTRQRNDNNNFAAQKKSNQNEQQRHQETANNKDHPIIKDDFEILLPKDWKETPPAMQGVNFTAVSLEDNFNDPDVKRINFRANYNVAYDTLNGKTFMGYIEYLKEMANKISPDFKIQNENSLEINEHQSYAIEGSMSQKNLQFKTLIVIVQGGKDDLWVISFNTLDKDWAKNSDLFTKIAKSFIVKKTD